MRRSTSLIVQAKLSANTNPYSAYAYIDPQYFLNDALVAEFNAKSAIWTNRFRVCIYSVSNKTYYFYAWTNAYDNTNFYNLSTKKPFYTCYYWRYNTNTSTWSSRGDMYYATTVSWITDFYNMYISGATTNTTGYWLVFSPADYRALCASGSIKDSVNVFLPKLNTTANDQAGRIATYTP